MPPLTRPQLSTRLRSLIHFVDDFIGASEQNCSLRQKKQTGILDFAHQGEPISEYLKANLPSWQRSGPLAGHSPRSSALSLRLRAAYRAVNDWSLWGCNVVGRWMTIWRQPHRSPIRRQIVIDRWRTGACYRPIWDPFQPVKSMSNGLELSLDPHEILLPSRYGNDLQRLLEVIGIVHTRRSLICCAWRSPRDDVHH
jgi:hypothetical protein